MNDERLWDAAAANTFCYQELRKTDAIAGERRVAGPILDDLFIDGSPLWLSGLESARALRATDARRPC